MQITPTRKGKWLTVALVGGAIASMAAGLVAAARTPVYLGAGLLMVVLLDYVWLVTAAHQIRTRGIHGSFRQGELEVGEGDDVTLEYVIHNMTSVPLPGVHLTLLTDPRFTVSTAPTFFFLPPGSEVTVLATIHHPPVGYVPVTGFSLVVDSYLGLFERHYRLMIPRLGVVEPLDGREDLPIAGGEEEWDYVRPFVPGDDPTRIDAGASMRARRPVVRAYSRVTERAMFVVERALLHEPEVLARVIRMMGFLYDTVPHPSMVVIQEGVEALDPSAEVLMQLPFAWNGAGPELETLVSGFAYEFLGASVFDSDGTLSRARVETLTQHLPHPRLGRGEVLESVMGGMGLRAPEPVIPRGNLEDLLTPHLPDPPASLILYLKTPLSQEEEAWLMEMSTHYDVSFVPHDA